MFTKYTDVDIPTNYSGNRFRKQATQDNTKIHKGESVPVQQIRTSVSPSFQASIDNATNQMEIKEESLHTSNGHALNEHAKMEFESYDDISSFQDESPKENNENEARGEEFSKNFKSSGLGQLLSFVGQDDLLLIALIVLLAGEQSSIDAIILLALLLLYH